MNRAPMIMLLTLASAFVAAVGLAGTEPPPHLLMRPLASTAVLERGKVVFHLACSPCHGSDGRGKGPLSANLLRPPTDLTRGVFTNRSTMCGELPLDFDLYHTVSSGIHNTAMPSFDDIAPEDRLAIVEFIKSIAPKFRDSSWYPIIPVEFDEQIPADAESIARGRAVYLKAKCDVCHGPEGKGDGVSVGRVNAMGKEMVRSDLTNRSDYRFSVDVQDLYRIFSSELDARKLSHSERWDLSNYVWSLRK